MRDPEVRFLELAMEGMGCSQMLVAYALEALGRENPDLLRAISALHGGIGGSGKVCGALSGGACALALYAEGSDDPRKTLMIRTLVDWFTAEVGARHGGIDCKDILEGDDKNRLARCPAIVLAVERKIEELLATNGIDPERQV